MKPEPLQANESIYMRTAPSKALLGFVASKKSAF